MTVKIRLRRQIIVPGLIGAAAVLFLCICAGILAIWLVSGERLSQASRAATSTLTPTITTSPSSPTATWTPTAPPASPTSEESTQPETPAGEPQAAIDTPIPATQAPAVTAFPPTATFTPTTTATPRLHQVSFSLEKSVVAVNERIWFNFSVANPSSTETLSYGYLGAVVLSEAGENLNFQASWTGSELAPLAVLNWRDGTAIGTPGRYRLQLSICYSAVSQCNTPQGEWELLASPVEVTVQ